MLSFRTLVVTMAMAIGISNAITISRFENVTSGIYDIWKNQDPKNVNPSGFGMVSDKGKVWLISRRLFRKNFDDPWDPASRGGIVSTLRLSNNSWIHKSYDRLDEDQYGDKLFSMGGHLFMLTYSTNQNKIDYHKLFFWNDEAGEWIQIPIDIDLFASTISTNFLQGLSVNVPDQNGSVVYLVASAHPSAQRGSELAFSRLDIQWRGNIPIKASIKSMAHALLDDPSSVVFTAVRENILYAFVRNSFSEGFVPEFDSAYTIDLKTNRLDNVTLTGVKPTMNFQDDRMFQIKNQVLIAGGSRMIGLGEIAKVDDIWSLNLDTLQWNGTNSKVPDWASEFALDQKYGKLYAASLEKGVSVANVVA